MIEKKTVSPGDIFKKIMEFSKKNEITIACLSKKIGGKLPVLTKAQLTMSVGRLFPTGKEFFREEIVADHIPVFTLEELLVAARGLSAGKSPGPDGLPAEVIRETVVADPCRVLQIMNWVMSNDRSLPPGGRHAWSC